MKANEAFINSVEGAHDRALKEYNNAIAEIKYAGSSMGEFKTWVDNLNKEARKLLREKGYRVRHGWYKYGYEISWKYRNNEVTLKQKMENIIHLKK